MYSGIEHIISVSFSLCHIMFIPCKFGKHGKDYDKVGGGGEKGYLWKRKLHKNTMNGWIFVKT